MEFSWCRIASQQNFSFPDVFQELWRLQGIKPYLPDKKEVDKEFQHIVKEYPKNSIRSYYLYKELPYDIEKKHLIEYREKIRQAPIGIRWTKEELDKFNSLSDVKEKRAMILKKSELKSVYIPHLKYEKEMIEYPNMPVDARSKSDFKEGLELFQDEEYEKAFPLLKYPSDRGNYIATHLLCLIAFKRLETDKFKGMYYWTRNYDVDRWIARDAERNNAILNEYKSTLSDIFFVGRALENKGLPVGAFLQAEVYYHNLKNLGWNRFDRRYRTHYVTHLMRAANMGSYDAYRRLAYEGVDLEWVLCAMISSLDYKCFDEFIINLDTDYREYTSPRNLAIVRLAAMWGSNYAMDCLTFGASGNFLTVFKHQILDGHPQGAIYMPDSEELYRRKIYNQFYGKETGVFQGTLIPELDTIFPPKPVIHSPYDMTPVIQYVLKMNPSLIHPLSLLASEETNIAFRKRLYDYESGLWMEEVLNSTKEYQSRKRVNDARRSMAMVTVEDIDRLFGYLNVIKLRELEQNPLYYPSGRPYIYSANIYRKYPDWY